MKAKETNKRFVNHLGLKLQKRKDERKLKKGKKKNINGGKDGSKPNGLKKQNLLNGKSKKKNKRNVLQQKQEESSGFQTISSNSDRLARLQEFVDREAGKVEKVGKKQSKSLETPVESTKEKNLIKNKQKLLSIQRDQEDDTKEINKMARLLGLRPTQKKRVAPIFSDDFGDIIADIEEGSMNRAKAYSDKGSFKKFLLCESDPEGSESSESDDDDDDVRDAQEISSHSSGKNLKDDDDDDDDEDDEESYSDQHFGNGLETIDEEDADEANESEESYDDNSKASDDSNSEQSEADEANESEESYDDNSKASDDSNSEQSEEEISDEEDSDEESAVERRKRNCFFDLEAEESDGEESYDEKPVHDETKEYELAFEGGSSFCKADYINNGILNDIDNYSSNSGDDTDLEGFVVNDDVVEHESTSEDILEESELKLSKRLKRKKKLKKNRLRIISDRNMDSCTSSDESEHDKDSKCKAEASVERDVANGETELKGSPLSVRKGRLRIRSESDKELDSLPPKKKARVEPLSDGDSFEVKSELALESESVNKIEAASVTNDCVTNNLTNGVDKAISKKGKKKKKKKKKAIMDENIEGTNVNSLQLLPKHKDMASGEGDNESALTSTKKKKKKKKLLRMSDEVSNEVQGSDQNNVNCNITSENIETKSNEVEVEVSSSKKKNKKKKKKSVKTDALEIDKEKNVEDVSTDHCDAKNSLSDVGDEASGIKEDIYGRLVDKEGNVIQTKKSEANGKYIPPALRKLMAMNVSEKKKEQLAMLKRNLKGLINRLAESNLAGIVSQIEGLYQKHSQNDMSDCLSQLLSESLVLPTLTPERLIQEHMLLIAVLSANVGNQVGAHILTDFVVKLHEKMEEQPDISSKEYDNILLIVASLFNFRVVGARLIYDILQRLADVFREKEVELILLVLRTVGFSLRKEDPLALKAFITQIQSQASQHQAKGSENYSRISFMLEIIHSIKNNNPSKVPNYDPTHVEHLKKTMKGLIHKGKNMSPLYVTLDDILKSKSQGRWWIVGSAWSGGLIENNPFPEKETVEIKKAACMEDEFSERFKSKAAKLKLNRPPRINIMYIITEGSEDYLDAFDKLLQLKLPTNQEQDMFHVILLCCQKGKLYNEFFSYLACRMCKFNKRYKRLLQFAVWDKFEEIENCKPREAENLAKFLVHLIGEDGLYITILKNLPLLEAGSQMIEFMRIILKGLLLHPGGADRVQEIFSRISGQPDLKFFTQSLKIFISKFLIPKKKKDKPSYQLLHERSLDVLELLSSRGGVSM